MFNYEGGRRVLSEYRTARWFTLDQLLTTESLPIREKHFAGNKELRRWPHHDDLSLPKIEEHNVSILIGFDTPNILRSEKEWQASNTL